MLTFKQFLEERVRNDDQAIKLGSYIAKKHGGKIPLKGYTVPNEIRKVAIGGPAIFKSVFKKPKQETVNTSDLIPTQKHTHFDADKARNKFGSDEPIDVLHHGGKKYIINGHHRFREATLKGKTSIQANIHTFGKQ